MIHDDYHESGDVIFWLAQLYIKPNHYISFNLSYRKNSFPGEASFLNLNRFPI